jgi:hypothetical protein
VISALNAQKVIASLLTKMLMMKLAPHKRFEWFTWFEVPLEWSQHLAPVPGFRWNMFPGGLGMDFHLTHLPLLPDEVQDKAYQIWDNQRRESTIPNMDLLRPYQQDAVLQLHAYRGSILAYEMRLGKTPCAMHLHDPATGALLITGPLSARESWKIWVEKILGVAMFCCTGTKNVDPLPGLPAYFCHYEILGAYAGFFQTQRVGTLVFDEFHLLQSKAALIAVRAFKLLGLSGTPMWNKPRSLYQLLHAISPGAWGTAFEFFTRYCDAQPGAHGWNYEGVSNAEELRIRLDQIMIRKTWAEVAPELPPTTRVLEPVGLTGAQIAAVEAAATRIALARGTASVAGYQATLRRKLAEMKIPTAITMAEQAAKDGHKVVLWTWHNEIAAKVAAGLEGNVFRIRSEDKAEVREQSAQDFRDAPLPAFMVAGMGVGGTGLDLSCADYAIFVELDYTPANVSQPEMRTFHISRPHVVVYLYTDDPIESRLIEALQVKNGFEGALGLSAFEIMAKVFT